MNRERRRGESVEDFDQTVGLAQAFSRFFRSFVICGSSRLIFKPKTDLNGDLEFFDFVFFNQPAHFRHFEPVYMA